MGVPITASRQNVLQKDAFWLVPAIANLAAPTLAEINAATGIYITGFMAEENAGWTTTPNKSTAPRALTEAVTPEYLQASTVQGSDFVGFMDPQAAPAHADKKAYEFLRTGFKGFMVRRSNKANDLSDQAVADEFVSVAPVQFSPAVEDRTATTAEGFYIFRCGVAVTGAPKENVKAVA